MTVVRYWNDCWAIVNTAILFYGSLFGHCFGVRMISTMFTDIQVKVRVEQVVLWRFS